MSKALVAVGALLVFFAALGVLGAMAGMTRVAVAPMAVMLIPLLLLPLAFWIWMVIDVAVNEPDEGNTKIVWLLIVLLGQFIGALIYFFVRRPQRPAGKA